MGDGAPPVRRVRLETGGPVGDIGGVGPLEVVDHRRDTWRSVDLERYDAVHHPGAEDQVGQTERVIGMQVCEEDDPQVRLAERLDAAAFGRGGATHDPGPGIDEIRRPLRDDGHGGTRSRRIGVGGAGPQQHDLGARRVVGHSL